VPIITKNPKTSQINNLLMHLEKQEQTKPHFSRWREITKIRDKSNEIETKQLYKESMKQKVGSLERLTRSRDHSQYDKREEVEDINKIRDEEGDITMNSNKIQKTISTLKIYIQVNWKI
jgi:hypothetical protein